MGRRVGLDRSAGKPRFALSGFRRSLQVCLFGLLPITLVTGVLASQGNAYGFEFRGNLWEPAKRILRGDSPYELHRLQEVLAGHWPASHGGYVVQAVYPAPIHVASVPLGLLPFSLAMAFFVVVSVACIVGALWLLGVRDWRCYGLAFLGIPVVHALNLGGITPLLMLGIAAAWRYRDSRALGAVATGAVIAAKLFLLPLTVWYVATRRLRAAGVALVAAVALAVGGWAAIGFADIGSYPKLLRIDTRIQEGNGYSVRTVGLSLGLTATQAQALALAIFALLLAACAVVSWRGNERGGFALALVASLTLSPIVWQQYFLLLLVPIALASPTLTPVWLLGLTFWLAPIEGHTARDLVVAWATAAAAVALALRAPRQSERAVPRVSPAASPASGSGYSSSPARAS
jgi:hypothetical protein